MNVPTIALKSSGKQVKLGRIRPVGFRETEKFKEVILPDGRVKTFAKLGAHWHPHLRTAEMVAASASVDWYTKAAAAIADMLGNDQWGDCVIASALHQAGVWTANETGTPARSNTTEAVNQYHTICGAGDNGCIITDVLDYTKSKGLKLSGVVHKIDDYVSIDWTNRGLVEAALQTFGSIKLGINLPDAWTDTNIIWDVTNTDIVGGHDVPAFGCGQKPPQVVGATNDGVVIATWGGLVLITWPAFTSKNWIEEAYVPLSPDWYSKGNVAPNGFDIATLRADLALVGSGQVPPIGPPKPPTPPVPPTPPPTPNPVFHELFEFDLTLNKNKGDKLTINHLPVAMAKDRYAVGKLLTKSEEIPEAE